MRRETAPNSKTTARMAFLQTLGKAVAIVALSTGCQAVIDKTSKDTAEEDEYFTPPIEAPPRTVPWWWPEPIPGVPFGTARYIGPGDIATCPTAFDGTLFSAVGFEFLAIDVDTTSVRWVADIYSDYQFLPGRFQRPQKQGQTIYYAYGNSPSTIYALDEATGSLRWLKNGVGGGQASDEQHVYGYLDRRITAFDRHTGAHAWSMEEGELGYNGGWFNPTGHHLFATGNGELRRVDEATGGTLWSLQPSVWDMQGDADHLVTQVNHDIVVLDPEDGSLLWSRVEEGDRGSYAGLDGTTVFLERQPVDAAAGTNRILLALDAATGEELWSTPLPDAIAPFSTAPPPLVDEHAVYSAVVGIFAFDKQTGEPLWQVPDFGADCFSVAHGKLYGTDGTVLEGGVYEIGPPEE